jgi:cytochrome P450
VKIPKGAHVFLCWAAANHDSNKFQAPDEFEFARPNAGQHATFGAGIHRCIGSMLARMEMKCAFREIVTRMDDVELAIPQDKINIWGTFVFRGPKSVPVRFRKRAV